MSKNQEKLGVLMYYQQSGIHESISGMWGMYVTMDLYMPDSVRVREESDEFAGERKVTPTYSPNKDSYIGASVQGALTSWLTSCLWKPLYLHGRGRTSHLGPH